MQQCSFLNTCENIASMIISEEVLPLPVSEVIKLIAQLKPELNS